MLACKYTRYSKPRAPPTSVTAVVFLRVSSRHETRVSDLLLLLEVLLVLVGPHRRSAKLSDFDNATLQLVLSNATVEGTKTAKVRVYATNYNVLRIMSGMGGLNELLTLIFYTMLIIEQGIKAVCYNKVSSYYRKPFETSHNIPCPTASSLCY